MAPIANIFLIKKMMHGQNLNFIKFLIDGNLGGIPNFMYDEKDAPDH